MSQKSISSLSSYHRHTQIFDSKNYPFLIRQKKRYLNTKPYTGLKVLLNIPLTASVLIVIDILQTSGCDLCIYASDRFLKIDPQLLACIEEAKIPLYFEKRALESIKFDVILDCTAEFHDHHPSLGISELTETGSFFLKNKKLSYPVITVNDTRIKLLECSLGTGDGFIRAFSKLVTPDTHKQSFIIFGFGRVGKGIVGALLNKSKNIFIVDNNESTLSKIKEYGLQGIHAKQISAVEKAIAASDVVVTATALENVLSQYEKKYFKGKILINMGAADEFGPQFSDSEVLFEKKAINFTLEEPTLIKYLDPTFYGLLMAIDFFCYTKLPNLVHPLPQFIAEDIFIQWQELFNEPIPFE
ncbi:MAG: NAD(P)-binding domain-containing protein [Phycisphaerales bacterium]|nr:NAD(P)-binding domain-containing protein [Phycisphaerales bacterium]